MSMNAKKKSIVALLLTELLLSSVLMVRLCVASVAEGEDSYGIKRLDMSVPVTRYTQIRPEENGEWECRIVDIKPPLGSLPESAAETNIKAGAIGLFAAVSVMAAASITLFEEEDL